MGTARSCAASGGGPVAVKPLDGHLFLAHPTAPIVIEATRLGKPVRTITLAGMAAPPVGLAYVRRAVEPPADATLTWDGGSAPARVEDLPLVS